MSIFRIIKNRLSKGVVTRSLPDAMRQKPADLEALGSEFKELVCKQFGRSFHIRALDTGSCGGCESEIIAATNPVYDIQRFGVDFVASPRHADALLVTGPVSKNMALALKKTYDAIPEPKYVITLGDCALGGGLFRSAYYVAGGVKNIIPVSAHIPGCPPDPITIIEHLLAFLKK
ncbi:MAG: NADH-quinone oxidoreductase subunit B family protein [Candidatus Omnitrophota bacterium]